uniref:Secreted protein n=1 Tax=Panagrellus redivivus TaxID=6233 RepID=A0A7E4VP16_PANRE
MLLRWSYILSYLIYLLNIQLVAFVDKCSARVLNFDSYPRSNNERSKRETTLEDFIRQQLDATNLPTETTSALGARELGSSEIHYLYRVQKRPSKDGRHRVQRRSISNAVIETARCEHIELLDCDDYDNDEMTCMVTATGMPCCICTGKLKSLKLNRKKKWSIW